MDKIKLSRDYILRDNRKSFYLFISFWIIGFAVFQLIPILWGFRVSLTNQMAFSVKPKFVGLENYVKVFQDGAVFYSIFTTLLYAVLNTVIQIFIGLILALLLEQKIKGQGFFRVVFYLPYVIPVVATGWIFRIFLDKNIGFLNILLTNLNLMGNKINWLGEHAMFSNLAASFWRVGWSLLIFIGGLSTIPDELYDAANVDGVRFLQRIRIITIPFLSPFIAFQLVVSFIYGMQIFILPYILNPIPIRGGQVTWSVPPKQTFFILSKGYDLIFTKVRLAYGFAVLWITFIIVLIFSLIYSRLVKKATYSEMEN
ncbi:MAG: sugar ABC transporter permease [Spirochaetales bacterium]|nr:MAG: sugar ABC transporter permease [Spirochaetales bacterium]